MVRDNNNSPDVSAFKLRSRSDLEVYPQRCRARKVWVIKDPISLRYFQFREEEYEILRLLDGRRNLEQIKALFEKRFTPQRMTLARLHAFVANLHRNALAISDTAGQGEQLLIRGARRQRDSWIATLSNPLAIRFRGPDPQPVLDWLYPRLRWCFSTWCVAACLLLISSALLLVLGQFGEFRSRLPELNSLISPGNLVWLAVALGSTKLLHEFGHALTCKHFGGDCHEMGVMLLVFTPCLYCNVTDAWKLPNRWHRIAITAAGIYVEVVLASVCALLWWYSQVGFFNTVCLNVMVVCSVGTVLLNGNPLLRYDGYYLLSDFMEFPNLWQDSRSQVRGLLSRFVWGFDPGNPVSLRHRSGMLLLYACCSMIYRVMVVTSVLYLIYRILTPLGLLLAAQIMTAMVIIGIVSVPIRSAQRTLASPIMRRRIKPRQVAFAASVCLAAAAGFFLIPLPCRIGAPVTIESLDARRVYVSVPGRLMQAVAIGDVVNAGDALGRLENTEIQRDLASVQGQWRRQQIRVRSLESLRGQIANSGAQLPAAKEMLADLTDRLTQLRRDQLALLLLAPVDGTVIAPPSVVPNQAEGTHLRQWIGTPQDERNLGCLLPRRTLFCLLGQPDKLEAVLSIDQSEIQYVQIGQRVRLQLDMAPGQVLQGTIREISRNSIQAAANEITSEQDLANRRNDTIASQPDQTSYEALVQIDASDIPLLIGAAGRAKIVVDRQPMSLRVYRFLTTTFKPILQ